MTIARRRRRWFQYSIRAILALMLIAAVCLAWYTNERRRVASLHRRIDILMASGAYVYNAEEWEELTQAQGLPGKPPSEEQQRGWREWLFGDKCDYKVHAITYGLRFRGSLYSPEYSQLREADIAAIESFPELRHLQLSYTNIGDEELAQLACLSQLESLDLTGLSISDEGIKSLQKMEQLQSLQLAGTQVSGAGLAALRELSHLEELDFAGNKIDDAFVDNLHAWPTKRLFLDWDALSTARICEILDQTPDLEVLWLFDAQINEEVARRIAGLGNLEMLDMSYTEMGDPELTIVARLPRLRELELSATRITSAGVQSLTKSNGLRVLDISETAVDDDAVAVLAEMKSLRQLTLWGTSISDDGIEMLRRRLPNCDIEW